ncbi:MAG TPA: hypothetical protein VNQ79_00030 [Blastocatellia bacterium]|nr:hypothetical protein [Blastocatellia bacterium]
MKEQEKHKQNTAVRMADSNTQSKTARAADKSASGSSRAGATGDDALGAGKTGSSMGVTSNAGGMAGTAGSVNKPDPRGEGRKVPPGSKGGCC